MYEMKSLSLLVGQGRCNGNCAHCGGKIHRKFAPKQDGILDEDLIWKTLTSCYQQGARSLSISSSGEPTLSPLTITRTLGLVQQCKEKSFTYSPINLYSNGIIIGNNQEFCNTYLPKWKDLGLTTIYITVHDTDEKRNAEVYSIKHYPKLEIIFKRIHEADILVRANLILSKRTVHTFEQYRKTVNHLKQIGADYISAWPIRNDKDQMDQDLSPLEEELDKMEHLAEQDPTLKVLREKNRIAYHSGEKLTLFPDGTLSSTWCN